MENLNSRKKSKGIQVFRGVAVFAVVLFHQFPSIFPNGYLGVDVFFVISGFVITPIIFEIFQKKILHREKFILIIEFYTKRLFRLLPAAGFSIFLFSLILIFLSPINDQQSTVNQGIASMLFIGNYGALRYDNGDYFGIHMNPFVHFWSLSVEAQFYFFLPIILIIFLIKSVKVKTKNIFILFLIIFSCSLSLYIYFMNDSSNLNLQRIIFYSTIFRVWEFAIGALSWLALYFFGPKTSKLGILLLSTMTIFVLFSRSQTDFYIVLVGIFTGLLLFFSNDILGINPITKIFMKIGDWSYSIYLVHFPILYVLMYSRFFMHIDFALKVIIYFLLTLALGFVIHKFIETKFRRIGSVTFKKLLISFFLIPIILLFSWRALIENTYFLTASSSFSDSKTSCLAGKGCSYNSDNAKFNLVLIGDSHAQAIAENLIKFTHKERINLTTLFLRGCQFVIKRDLTSQECANHNSEVIRFLNDTRELNQKIIVVQRSSDFNDSNNYLNSVLSGIALLRSLRDEVLVVGPVPEIREDAELTIWDIGRENLNLKLSDLNSRSFIDDVEYRKSSLLLDFQYFSAVEVLCQVDNCEVIRGNRRLYWDNSHFSNYGAQILIEQLVLKDYLP